MIREFAKVAFRSSIYHPMLYNSFCKKVHHTNIGTQTEEEIKANQVIAECKGLNQFLFKVYNTTGMSIAVALSSSYLVMSVPFLAANMASLSIFGIFGMLGGLIGANYVSPKYITEIVDNAQVYKTVNTPLRLGLYGLGCVSLGLTAAPLFYGATLINPSIMPMAIGLTSSIFGGASLIAYNMPAGKMLGYGRVLFGGLLGLIGLQLVGLLSALIVGPNMLSTMLFQADNYLGIALFTGFIAYDTHLAIKMYQMKQADHIGMSIQFLLDFWNILVRIVSILSRRD